VRVSPSGSEKGQLLALPASGAVLADVRGDSRWMRVTWHDDPGDPPLVVLSIWRDGKCSATLRLARADVPALVSVLVDGLSDTSPDAHPETPAGLPSTSPAPTTPA
jgi:hypothetical protein